MTDMDKIFPDPVQLECVACGKTKHTDDPLDNMCECGGPMSKVAAYLHRRASIAGSDPMPASQLTPPRMGWVCSKCERSLAPHVEECPCSAKGWHKGIPVASGTITHAEAFDNNHSGEPIPKETSDDPALHAVRRDCPDMRP